MHLQTWLYTKLFGKLMGIDEFGNKYYESNLKSNRNSRFFNRKKRWVIYTKNSWFKLPEPTTITNTWFNWLRHRNNILPSNIKKIINNDTSSSIKDIDNKTTNTKTYFWEKYNTPNITGIENNDKIIEKVHNTFNKYPVNRHYTRWKE